MKIKATPEGRPNIWIPEKESLKEYIKAQNWEGIHHFYGDNPMVLIGADHDVESVLEDIDNAERVAIFTDDSNVGHSLAVILNNRLNMFDIGKLTEEMLDTSSEV